MRLIYLVAPEHAETLLDPLREHVGDEPGVTVLVERRRADADALQVQRRAPVAERDPRRAVPSDLAQDGVRLVQPLPPVAREHEATGLEELVALSLADEPGAVSELWWRLGGRATARLRLRVSAHRADQVTSPLLGRVLDELPGYDPVKTTLDAWLDAVVDRFAADLT